MSDFRTALKDALSRWHQSTCYPQASSGELDIGADAVLAALSASIGEDVVEAAAKHVLDEAERVKGRPITIAESASLLWSAKIVTPILALAARDATLEEAIDAADSAADDAPGEAEAEGAMEARDRIRALKGGPARG